MARALIARLRRELKAAEKLSAFTGRPDLAVKILTKLETRIAQLEHAPRLVKRTRS